MDDDKPGKQDGPTIRELYPRLSEEQLKEAEENLERYVELTLRVYDRIRSDPSACAEFQSLTAWRRNATMKTEKVEP
jgi:phosphoglycolate phosphatase-like HAD superfamily hydrolase